MPETDVKSQAENLLQYHKGVGPARAQILSQMGLRTREDLLRYYPRGWEDRRSKYTLREAPIGEKTTLRGTIESVDFSQTRSGLGMAMATLSDKTGKLDAVWFKKVNFRYDVFASLKKNLQVGKVLLVFGSVEWGPHGRQLRVEDAALVAGLDTALEGDDQFHFDRIVPQYTVPEGLNEKLLRALIARALQGTLAVPSLIPAGIRVQRTAHPQEWVLRQIHFPDTLVQSEEARQVLAFEEFLVLETALAQLRRNVKQALKPHGYHIRRNLLTPFREGLGFEFTGAQKRVIREVFDDLLKPEPMNRLLQGDVGSGKTVVALSAMLLALENGGQAALMAPTEILAEQHAFTFSKLLANLPVRMTVLTGRQPAAQKKKALVDIAKGKIQIIVGTHALIQKQVRFHKLMLVVIDEQHRFGVEHRALLRSKGAVPDILVMTATPIPRTLAMTVYGDLDVSVLDQLPPGRSPITTTQVSEQQAHEVVCATALKGEQAYIVYPLVSESDKVTLKAVTQEAERLQKSVYRNFKVGILHGQMSGSDKEQVMARFRNGEIQILFATSIIEVGIDVPNATLMVIQHAERFGLATLHQLRGRVGRGAKKASCLLVADHRGSDGERRIRIMTETTDGFLLSEEDLSMRGPGEVLGAMQHGLPSFKLGHLIRDARLIQESRVAAQALIEKDPALLAPQHQLLRQAVSARYGAAGSDKIPIRFSA